MPVRDRWRQQQLAARHYEQNKATMKARARACTKRAVARNKEYINSVLEKSSCVDCGCTDREALEFDHVRGVKKNNVSDLVRNGCSLKTVRAEIEKCDIRCVLCHRKRTNERRAADKLPAAKPVSDRQAERMLF